MPWAYVSRDVIKSALGITTTTDDARIRAALEAVARSIDDACDRTFRIRSATRYYSAGGEGAQFRVNPGDRDFADARRITIDDLTAIVSLKVDQDGDQTYETTWAAADYNLLPYNAPDNLAPYQAIERTLNGAQSFPVAIPRGIEVVGSWGYFQELAVSASVVGAAGINASATTLPVTTGTNFETLQTILVESEQMYVTAISGNNLTVERGVNGTTAAAHVSGVAISVYRYPAPIVAAATIQTMRIFKRNDAPFGVTGASDFGQSAVIARIDPDVKQLLQTYRRLVAA